MVLRGVNDRELGELARFAWRHGAIARYIEPDATRGWGPARHRMQEEPLRSMVRIGG